MLNKTKRTTFVHSNSFCRIQETRLDPSYIVFSISIKFNPEKKPWKTVFFMGIFLTIGYWCILQAVILQKRLAA